MQRRLADGYLENHGVFGDWARCVGIPRVAVVIGAQRFLFGSCVAWQAASPAFQLLCLRGVVDDGLRS